MKRLSDYKDDEAFELWADLLEPLSVILSDAEIKKVVASGASKISIAKTVMKSHAKEAKEIMLRIDPTPLNGFNLVMRLVQILAEIGEDETVKSFFGFAEQAKTESGSSGSPTESTEAVEK